MDMSLFTFVHHSFWRSSFFLRRVFLPSKKLLDFVLSYIPAFGRSPEVVQRTTVHSTFTGLLGSVAKDGKRWEGTFSLCTSSFLVL